MARRIHPQIDKGKKVRGIDGVEETAFGVGMAKVDLRDIGVRLKNNVILDSMVLDSKDVNSMSFIHIRGFYGINVAIKQKEGRRNRERKRFFMNLLSQKEEKDGLIGIMYKIVE